MGSVKYLYWFDSYRCDDDEDDDDDKEEHTIDHN